MFPGICLSFFVVPVSSVDHLLSLHTLLATAPKCVISSPGLDISFVNEPLHGALNGSVSFAERMIFLLEASGSLIMSESNRLSSFASHDGLLNSSSMVSKVFLPASDMLGFLGSSSFLGGGSLGSGGLSSSGLVSGSFVGSSFGGSSFGVGSLGGG